MKTLIIFVALALVTAAIAADHIVNQTVTETFSYAKGMNDPPTILPAIYKICESLGIPKNSCITNQKYGSSNIASYSLSQTNKTLWYIGESSSTGFMSDTDCHNAIAIEHYVTYDGTVGTVYECLAPPEDDEITAADLAALSRYAEHANSIGKKTLADHEIALQFKHLASFLATK